MVEPYHIEERIRMLRKNAATRWTIDEKDCHIGHLILQAMWQEPDIINQIEGTTGLQETNLSVVKRTTELASAMTKYGLKIGDTVVIMGNNHLDLCIPFFACHANGYNICAIDPSGTDDLEMLWKCIRPKMIFCQKSCEEKIKKILSTNDDSCEVICFDDEEGNMKTFMEKYGGTAINYRPAIIDQSKNSPAWLIFTSGTTTGAPKVAIVPFSTILNAIICWWLPVPEKIGNVLTMSTLQWMSALMLYITGPIKAYTRLQSQAALTPQLLISIINQYKPCLTAWTPYLFGRFLSIAENVCDLTCFKHISIGGSAIEKSLVDKMKKVCNARINLVYGMTELMVPVFEFNEETPYGSSGKPFFDKYEYKLIDNDGDEIKEPHVPGELRVRGDAFFKGYLNNEEETKHTLTEDGWVKTGDVFYKDNDEYYYFVERKRLLIKHYGLRISPLKMEEVLKRHHSVAEVCVVDIPDPECKELPVAAILRKNNDKVDFEELFEFLNNNFSQGQPLSTGFFFVDSFPETVTGKLHRAKVKEIAMKTQCSIFNRNL